MSTYCRRATTTHHEPRAEAIRPARRMNRFARGEAFRGGSTLPRKRHDITPDERVLSIDRPRPGRPVTRQHDVTTPSCRDDRSYGAKVVVARIMDDLKRNIKRLYATGGSSDDRNDAHLCRRMVKQIIQPTGNRRRGLPRTTAHVSCGIADGPVSRAVFRGQMGKKTARGRRGMASFAKTGRSRRDIRREHGKQMLYCPSSLVTG